MQCVRVLEFQVLIQPGSDLRQQQLQMAGFRSFNWHRSLSWRPG